MRRSLSVQARGTHSDAAASDARALWLSRISLKQVSLSNAKARQPESLSFWLPRLCHGGVPPSAALILAWDAAPYRPFLLDDVDDFHAVEHALDLGTDIGEVGGAEALLFLFFCGGEACRALLAREFVDAGDEFFRDHGISFLSGRFL